MTSVIQPSRILKGRLNRLVWAKYFNETLFFLFFSIQILWKNSVYNKALCFCINVWLTPFQFLLYICVCNVKRKHILHAHIIPLIYLTMSTFQVSSFTSFTVLKMLILIGLFVDISHIPSYFAPMCYLCCLFFDILLELLLSFLPR